MDEFDYIRKLCENKTVDEISEIANNLYNRLNSLSVCIPGKKVDMLMFTLSLRINLLAIIAAEISKPIPNYKLGRYE